MNFDETMMLLNALGSWVAGAGSLAAVAIALWLARRVEKVKLDAWAGHRILVVPRDGHENGMPNDKGDQRGRETRIDQ